MCHQVFKTFTNARLLKTAICLMLLLFFYEFVGRVPNASSHARAKSRQIFGAATFTLQLLGRKDRRKGDPNTSAVGKTVTDRHEK